jgi:hypothetical protein
VRGIFRRLERLEARVGRVNESFSITINFVHPEKGVTSTLQIGPGKQEWIKREGEQNQALP